VKIKGEKKIREKEGEKYQREGNTEKVEIKGEKKIREKEGEK
jgi:hypothetical protein